MRVGLLSLPSNFHCQKWAQALQRAGAEITVFSFEAEKIDGVECVRLNAPFRWGGVYRYPSYWFSAQVLERELRQRNIDLLHPLHLTPFGAWGARSGFRPMISAAMGADVLEYAPKNAEAIPIERGWRNTDGSVSPINLAIERARRRFFKNEVRLAVKHSDLITADNQTLIDGLRDWFHCPTEKLRLLRWGIEPELFETTTQEDIEAIRKKLNISPEKRVVLSPRGANAVYQADMILKGFELALKQGVYGFHFVMLGAGYAVSEPLSREAAQLSQLYSNFTFYSDQLSRRELAALWRLTDLFVSAPVADGYSAAVAEGRFMGAVPIVNAIPANNEILTHKENAFFVEPFTPENLCERLIEVINLLPPIKPAFARRNREWIEKNSLVSVSANQFLSLAEAVIAKSK